MFYGVIGFKGSLEAGYASSNNFTVTKGGTGVYTITFTELLGTKPTVVVSREASTGNQGGNTINFVTHVSAQGGGVYSVQVQVFSGSDPIDKRFAFQARAGGRQYFDASSVPTVTLDPALATNSNTGSNTIQLSTTSLGGTVQLDAYTELSGTYEATSGEPSGRLTVELSTNTIDDGSGNSWTLKGYTYAYGTGPTGQEWPNANSNGDANTSVTLSVDPSGGGPQTSLEALVIVGTPSGENDESNQYYISTDPRVRLTSVPPGGMTLSR